MPGPLRTVRRFDGSTVIGPAGPGCCGFGVRRHGGHSTPRCRHRARQPASSAGCFTASTSNGTVSWLRRVAGRLGGPLLSVLGRPARPVSPPSPPWSPLRPSRRCSATQGLSSRQTRTREGDFCWPPAGTSVAISYDLHMATDSGADVGSGGFPSALLLGILGVGRREEGGMSEVRSDRPVLGWPRRRSAREWRATWGTYGAAGVLGARGRPQDGAAGRGAHRRRDGGAGRGPRRHARGK